MKTLKLFIILIPLLALFACEEKENSQSEEKDTTVSNVSWTPCKQDVLKSSGLSNKVNVEFTNKGVQITYLNFEVSCDFTIVNVTHTFVNGVLNITQQGSPNQANCVCHSDVSYTIDGISQNEVNVIFINGVQIYCYNENKPEIDEVEKYVNSLRTNQYDDRDLPAFIYKHIDKLLEYRNEKDIITTFPRNPLSSLWLNECELGVYILWTIEYIRIKTANSDLLIIGKFPSMNPILKLRDSEELELVYNVEAYQIASDAYYAWWTNNQDKSVIEIMEIDPLENTIYQWH